MNKKDFFIDAVIIGMSASLLWHFSNIWRYGQYFAQEPNIIIRSLETVWFLFILAFGISKFIGDLKRLRSYRKASRNRAGHVQVSENFQREQKQKEVSPLL